jgi:hypothetical protein
MLTRAQLDQWIDENGPYLGHEVAGERMIPFVLRDGLMPRALTGQNRNSSNPRLHSRPNHVYLGTGLFLKQNFMTPTFLVDLRKLDPARFDVDEDRVFEYLNLAARGLPGACELDAARPGKHDLVSGGDWADSWSALCDRPEWVMMALEMGSCAYRGTIPPRALKLNPREYAVCDWDPAPAGARLRVPGEQTRLAVAA